MRRKTRLELYRIAKKAAAEATAVLRSEIPRLRAVHCEKGHDLKIAADTQSEAILLSALKKTGHAFLSEEQGASAKNCLDGPCWILDPLDGSLNYARGFPMCAISIAFWDEGRPQFGIIQDIGTGDLYTGAPGEGAFCNGAPIRVSNIDSIGQAVLATGFPTGRNYDAASLDKFVFSIQRYKKIRMIGSAALSLVNVAAGCFEAYTEDDIWIWDVAAGLALVEAAGGKTEYSALKPGWKLDVFASNGRVPAFAGTGKHDKLRRRYEF